MEIRKADSFDENQVTKIRIEYLKEQEKLEDEMRKRLVRGLDFYWKEHLNRDLVAFLAYDQDKVIGSAFLQIVYKPNSPSFPNGKTGVVLNVYVIEAYRRKGIASKLITEVLEEAKRRNLDYVELKATKAGEELYRKCGFLEEQDCYLRMKQKLSRIERDGN